MSRIFVSIVTIAISSVFVSCVNKDKRCKEILESIGIEIADDINCLNIEERPYFDSNLIFMRFTHEKSLKLTKRFEEKYSTVNRSHVFEYLNAQNIQEVPSWWDLPKNARYFIFLHNNLKANETEQSYNSFLSYQCEFVIFTEDINTGYYFMKGFD